MERTKQIGLLEEHGIRYHTDKSGYLELCLDDFVEKIAECKNSYLSKIRGKIKRKEIYYKYADTVVLELCPKLRSIKAREFQTKWTAAAASENDDSSEDTVAEAAEETTTSFLDIRNNYFQYKGKKVLVIVRDGVAWFKGVDVANLLSYQDIHQTLRINVQDSDKRTFMTLGVCTNTYPESQKIDPQTIFINLEGMYDLVFHSKKEEAKIFRRWLSHEVLPSINKFGFYSIEKKYGCFYDDHDLYEYDGCNVCYIAYIGVHDNLPLFKYGISFDYYRREYQEHRKLFDTFQLLYLRHADNNHTVESLFTKECKSKDVYIKKEFKGKNQVELFTINEHHTFERMRMIMDKLIEQHPTQEHKKYEKEIQSLRHEKELMSKEIERLGSIQKEKDERINDLQCHNASLQNDKIVFYKMIKNFESMIKDLT